MGVRHRKILGQGVNNIKLRNSSRHPQHVRVYLVAPGEITVSHEKNSDIDPMLPPAGLLQAKRTWEQLLSDEAVFREKQKQNYEEHNGMRMQMFTSPLKRCMDTAIAILAASIPESIFADASDRDTSNHPRFPLPISSSEKLNEWNDEQTVNVVVLNGLCDADSNIKIHGGAAKVVSEGLIDCAAASILDVTTGTYKGNVIDNVLVRTMEQVRKEALFASDVSYNSSKNSLPFSRVQFWREETIEEEESKPCGFARMHSKESYQTTRKEVSADCSLPSSKESQSGRRRKMMSTSSNRFPERDSFMGAINHAAYLTAKAGAPVCVIITDWDGIKLLTQSCGCKNLFTLQDATTIAKFSATVYFPTVGLLSDHGAFSINWAFYGCSTNNRIKENDEDPIFAPTMNNFFATSRCNGPRVQISLNLDLRTFSESYPLVEHVTLGLLAPPMDVSLLGSASIPNNLSITYYSKKKRVFKDFEKENGATTIPLDILHGRHKIGNFIQTLKDEKRTACGKFDSRDGSCRTFVIDPLNQPAFPCPPCTLYVVLCD